jgi:Holliday junction DNA helicase RuvA
MIASLRGRLLSKSPTEAVIDVGGVGFSLFISLQSYETLPDSGEEVECLTHLHVREDALALYGFSSEGERQMFLHLIGISGIGPKLAMSILGGRKPEEIRNLVLRGDIGALTTLPGIGRKTAERLVLELKDKFAKSSMLSGTSEQPGSEDDLYVEALKALLALGYPRTAAEQAISRIRMAGKGETGRVEELIRGAIKLLSA